MDGRDCMRPDPPKSDALARGCGLGCGPIVGEKNRSASQSIPGYRGNRDWTDLGCEVFLERS